MQHSIVSRCSLPAASTVQQQQQQQQQRRRGAVQLATTPRQLGQCAQLTPSHAAAPDPAWCNLPQRGVQARAAPSAAPLRSTDEPIVEEVMTPNPVLLKPTMSCKEAARLLLKHDVSGAPVVDDEGHLVGILSESDLLWKGAGVPLEHTIIPTVFIGAFDLLVSLRDNKAIEEEVKKIVARTVADSMTRSPMFTSPSTSMSAAATLMLGKKVNRLPVVDNGKVVGMLTRHDVLRGMVASKNVML